LLSYWLCSCAVLYHLVKLDVGKSGVEKIPLSLRDIEQLHVELPKPNDTEGAALRFRDELELVTVKIYGILLRNLLTFLALPTKELIELKKKRKKKGKNPIDDIISYLTYFLTTFQHNCVHASLAQQFFQQVLPPFNFPSLSPLFLRFLPQSTPTSLTLSS